MAKLTLDVPTQHVQTIIDAYSTVYNQGFADQQGAVDFIREALKDEIKRVVKEAQKMELEAQAQITNIEIN